MSEAQAPKVSPAPQGTPLPAGAGAPTGPTGPQSAIQLIESEVQNFLRQREQAVANIHAIEGAIQAAQHLLNRLKTEEAKAFAVVKSGAQEVVTAVETDAKAILEKQFGAPVEILGVVNDKK